MLVSYAPALADDFAAACRIEHVFGSKIACSLSIFGDLHPRHRFFLARENGRPVGALYQSGNILTISASEEINAEEVADLVRAYAVTEVDSSRELSDRLQQLLGGTQESSFYMVCEKQPPSDFFPGIEPGNPEEVFSVLQQSHEYYRTHLQFEPWVKELSARISHGAEVYQLVLNGQAIGTGSILSLDDECAVIGSVAVIPAMRGRGFGTFISRFLTQRIFAIGRTPRLIAGYDEVAALYRAIGYQACGRWGELYL